ncbi:MAG: glutaminyl-tRNA synthase (glutamine-hydrolyzing) subunit B [Candidatus Yanofskybacteria bacterium RIFCSPHIGHO2_01_FULL_43_42]|uniref:Aspartyl/glutamyl-tRNA(Asn/Gln) amidotransferase subunit B n=1 Tax=Candidatus Taylorbacteria bacterium RIFCSPLOWO2_01_FULL_45_15b TaxID=1802319 RepID=A0A1G2NFA6_9BACT|nr:MAG: glutaminyl-tRNA synthase (glutamine-hydrolyzing) subunit B [Candidatus Yanofskybacteria bacterium RIFCSPHIGHO2_01_FULL_43_42]OHA34768.1 MAG: glutaminyl-tRNA synthase (glutamine-hydrolyzing) subunit B [Candidatus Taylorbacteria bacterium RIFCSPLOWO2_01_FULL_45_15b]
MKYKVTIGLEVHAELATKTKMFCNSKNDPDEKRPNVNICPICMAHPGTLPVANMQAIKNVLFLGAAVGGKLATVVHFDRKHYFYPDIPKGYQLSQYDKPLVSGGELAGVKLRRVHIEEDTARSIHDQGLNRSEGSIGRSDSQSESDLGETSLVDFNRAGVPLMELVTEPVIHDAETAVRFAKELQLLLTTLGIAEANMEKGEMRVEANISVLKDETFGLNQSALSGLIGPRATALGLARTGLSDKPVLGTKVEVKNLNSFRAVERAIKYEVERHIDALESGEKLVQETRGWNDAKQATYSQRSKEDSHDYRYFPDPDLPPIDLAGMSDFSEAWLKANLPELPIAKRARLVEQFGIKQGDAELYVLNPDIGKFFEEVAGKLKNQKKSVLLASNYIASDLIGLRKQQDVESFGEVNPSAFSKLISMNEAGDLSSRGVKDILAIMFVSGGEPAEIAKKHGLLQQHDEGVLRGAVQEVIDANPNAVAEYMGGKEASLQFLVGQGMKATKGAANPTVLKSLLIDLLKK